MRSIRVEDFESADLEPMVRMWRESFEYGVGVVDPHSIEEQIVYFEREVRPKNRVRVARDGDVIVGVMAASEESVAQLYVRVGHHRRGIGSRLLGLAKTESGGTLWLFTFAQNTRACAFYESQGFTVANRGFEPTWQLDDVKYTWARSAGAV
jgi:ribosomal protein S18 acetylase RimI-like enzyme